MFGTGYGRTPGPIILRNMPVPKHRVTLEGVEGETSPRLLPPRSDTAVFPANILSHRAVCDCKIRIRSAR
jgi:hypothetical protein